MIDTLRSFFSSNYGDSPEIVAHWQDPEYYYDLQMNPVVECTVLRLTDGAGVLRGPPSECFTGESMSSIERKLDEITVEKIERDDFLLRKLSERPENVIETYNSQNV